MKSPKNVQPDKDENRSGGDRPPRENPPWRFSMGYLGIALLVLMIWHGMMNASGSRSIPYSEFKKHVDRGEVTECSISADMISGKIVPKTDNSASDTAKETSAAKTEPQQRGFLPKFFSKEPPKEGEPYDFSTVRVDNDKDLIEKLEKSGTQFVGNRPGFFEQFIMAWVLPLALLIGLWVFITRKIGMGGQSILSIGKSKARVSADRETGVTFADVAGCDEAKYELQEVVDFLKNPARYKALGAQIPKGVLLVGPPGTGKTLLARAVAGEAKVVFFSLSGSDFVEMFVGVGAARVRDLFQQAKAQSPCIIFIDEMDAIGRQRGVHLGSVNDEREQTLNQLLVEMDGFETNAGVIILAATNRPDVLDHALLRPGRFDRQVVVDAPDLDGREAILKVHSRTKPLASDVDLRRVAQSTPGFSGADLANALNEAALLAARRLSSVIAQSDLEEAIEKVIAGTQRRSRHLREKEIHRVAVHESGHALVGAYDKDGDPVQKISIVPRGRSALGYTMQVPPEDQFILTRSELMARIAGLLGGRAAEEISFAEVSTGAEHDLKRATSLARQMVCMYGMTDTIGLTHCLEQDHGMFTGVEGYRTDCSQETTRLIDKEVLRLLNEAYDHAKKILLEHKEQLKIVTDELLEKEMLDAQRFYELLGMEVPQPPPPVLRKEEEPPPPPPAEDAEEDTPKDPGNISGEEKRE
ncbi:MAG: ATP-dependent zinc metalloprotease FtsH [Verrucomicrobia bacterium]|nr:ATP-dependent zinc metalloprotease FtsH [Verrucomicrobiota bacterium]